MILNLILKVKMETRHPVDGSFDREFPAICNHCVVMAAREMRNLCVFLKKYGKIFKIMFQTFSLRHRSPLFCSNFVKFGRQEISEVVRFLPDKNQNLACLPNCRYGADRLKSVRASPQQCAQSAADFIQIGSVSAEL